MQSYEDIFLNFLHTKQQINNKSEKLMAILYLGHFCHFFGKHTVKINVQNI